MSSGKIHMETSSVRHLGYGETAQIMLCGTGWGGDIDSTRKPAVVTCGRCLARMRVEARQLSQAVGPADD